MYKSKIINVDYTNMKKFIIDTTKNNTLECIEDLEILFDDWLLIKELDEITFITGNDEYIIERYAVPEVINGKEIWKEVFSCWKNK